MSPSLPDNPNLDWLRKQAKRRLDEIRERDPTAQLADAQFDLAREYGFSSWRALKAHVDSLTVEGRLLEAARAGNLEALTALLDEHPDKLRTGLKPYGWTLLHVAAQQGHAAMVDLLVTRGLDVNSREKGDNTYPMHWAAAAGHLDVVRRLADVGGDVIGRGDDHELEIIGWATCWGRCDDAAHRAVADFLVSRGARHHIFSAISMGLEDEVLRIVTGDPSSLNKRMSRHENHKMPLHFAVLANRPEIVGLLIDLGADPLAVDSGGQTAATYAKEPGTDRRVMEKISGMTASELLSTERSDRVPRATAMDFVAALSLADWKTAGQILRANGQLIDTGALHLMAKRNDIAAVRWLLANGANPNVRWAHWDADVTPLHLATMNGHTEIVRALLAGGADPGIHDSKHDSDAIGWAEFFKHLEIVTILQAHRAPS